jgi:GNAT superfamily N-acetyltransferase
MLRASRRFVDQPNNTALIARVDGVPAGAAMVAIAPDNAAVRGAGLFGTSVLPEFRCRGIQQLLMFERLRLARERGAAIATIASIPGIPTERNAARLGFVLSYVEANMIKPGAPAPASLAPGHDGKSESE